MIERRRGLLASCLLRSSALAIGLDPGVSNFLQLAEMLQILVGCAAVQLAQLVEVVRVEMRPVQQ
ncbi:hypothetical protein D8B29_01005 [Verminephrobacter eiseniae]|nr:hypothetical protein [Verminephrobacter eiseniae]MCW5302671.1 hypothetical protein [Verminephrobacter eiseniae]MCW8178270.1 hypothetical protein [Verminephrobacter eiseniae]MCW8189000.1 hypothetical protein [Verminephrobacter eiseniae]